MITVTGLVDVDVVDGLAGIVLSAPGVDPVTVNTAIHDHDKVDIVTDIATSGVLSINEAQTADVHVHLSHQPPADVRVKVTLGAGPVTVSPAEHTFTAANYSVDQTFTFSAPVDVNIVSEDESLTFSAIGSADRPYTIHDVDRDTLNISVNTPNGAALQVPEGGSVQIDVALTKQPPPNTTVTVHLERQRGNVSLDHTDLMFTSLDFDHAQSVAVMAPQDLNTSNETDQITLSIPGSTVTPVVVGVTTIDDDVQAILEDAPNPLSVTENQSATFGVTLKFQPSGNVTVTVNSAKPAVATASPGTLTFTAQNYNDPLAHQVTVRGSDDNNLATDMTSITLHEPTLVDKLVPVNVPDDDTQAIVLSAAMLSIPEGMSKPFDVSLKFDPGNTVTVSLSNTNQTSLPIDRTSITFTGGASGNYATPVRVTVSAPVDSNNVSETATVTVSGAGATPATVMTAVGDSTVVQNWGWPTPFPTTTTVSAEFAFGYQVSVGAVATLDSFHTYVPTAVGNYRMALYTDAGGVPGTLVADMGGARAVVNGVNDAPVLNGATLSDPSYFVVIRFSADTNIGFAATGVTGRQCFRNTPYQAITDAWATSFGASTCATARLMNLWFTTVHQ